MTTQTVAMPATHFRRGWIYVLTLRLVTINYMDRSALGVVAQAVRSEFGLSPVEMGYLFSSFLWTYVVCLLPIGIMLDRFSHPDNQFGRHRGMVARYGGDRRRVEFRHADRSVGLSWARAKRPRSVLRPHRAGMDAGPGARRCPVFWSAGSFVGPASAPSWSRR